MSGGPADGIVAVDIGGTFTDLVAYEPATGGLRTAKVLTTPSDLTLGVFAALDGAGVDVAGLGYLKHGTTTAINTVIERTGVKTALITTAGFRDVLESGRGNRPTAFDLGFRRLAPLVPRTLRFEIDARMDGQGRELRPVDVGHLEALAARMAEEGVEAVAVCLLHGYRAPEHELTVGRWLRENTDLFVTLSHELSREWREYERTSTTVVNAYVGPRMARYLAKFGHDLEAAGFPGTFFVMESNGGVLNSRSAVEKPVYLLESGPVAGVVGVARLSRQLGYDKAISFDMGGTTAKCALVDDGHVEAASTYYVGGYEEGYAVQVPVVDIIEVGAGGGSIAWIDEAGLLKVGPRSAGADPGPVCYGRGGRAPTVTDANLVLGRLDVNGLLGGDFPLDAEAAERAIREHIAEPLGIGTTEAAEGIVRLGVVIMSSAVRRISLERGFDPRDFVLMTTGGAGPLHAAAIARELSIPRVVVPPLPGHFSAWGMLLADVRHDYAQTLVARLADAPWARLEEAFAAMEAEARTGLRDEAPSLEEVAFSRYADIRYVGQEHTVRTPLPAGFGAAAGEQIEAAFKERYERRFGRTDLTHELELIAVRLVAEAKMDKPTLTASSMASEGDRAAAGETRTFFVDTGWVQTPIYARDALAPGDRISGPAIIGEAGSTTVIGPGDAATVDPSGSLVVDVTAKPDALAASWRQEVTLDA